MKRINQICLTLLASFFLVGGVNVGEAGTLQPIQIDNLSGKNPVTLVGHYDVDGKKTSFQVETGKVIENAKVDTKSKVEAYLIPKSDMGQPVPNVHCRPIEITEKIVEITYSLEDNGNCKVTAISGL